jgi:hypothetical protein
MWLSSVVLPAPRNPVRMVTGSGLGLSMLLIAGVVTLALTWC